MSPPQKKQSWFKHDGNFKLTRTTKHVSQVSCFVQTGFTLGKGMQLISDSPCVEQFPQLLCGILATS